MPNGRPHGGGDDCGSKPVRLIDKTVQGYSFDERDITGEVLLYSNLARTAFRENWLFDPESAFKMHSDGPQGTNLGQ